MTTAEAARASLPLAAVIADLRAAHAAASGPAQRSLAQDLRWARRDAAYALQRDADALRLAERLAEQGDEEAIAAVQRARELEPLPPPTSAAVVGADRNLGSRSSSAPPVPGGLLDRLVDARRRGEEFDRAWSEALAALDAARGDWGETLRSTKPAWRAAYERRPPPPGYVVLSWDDEDCGHEF